MPTEFPTSESTQPVPSKQCRKPRSSKRANQVDPLLLDAESAAVLLNISTRFLWTLTNIGAIPSVKISRRVLYRQEHLIAWLDAGAPTEPGSANKVLRDLRRDGGAR